MAWDMHHNMSILLKFELDQQVDVLLKDICILYVIGYISICESSALLLNVKVTIMHIDRVKLECNICYSS